MSHYTVLVKFEAEDIKDAHETIYEMLAPYDENKNVEEYIDKYKSKAKEYLQTEIDENTQIFSLPEEQRKHYNIEYIRKRQEKLLAMTPEEWWEKNYGQYDEYETDSDGNILSTYNPDSKWDWYQIGGRWSGMLKVKDGAIGLCGKPGIFDNEVGIDIAFLKDVDFDAMDEAVVTSRKEQWDNYQKELKKSKDPSGIRFMYNVEEDDTKETYLARYPKFNTYAVLDKDGWHSSGEMGWFGCSSETPDEKKEFITTFRKKFLENYTDKTVIAIVDCHI